MASSLRQYPLPIFVILFAWSLLICTYIKVALGGLYAYLTSLNIVGGGTAMAGLITSKLQFLEWKSKQKYMVSLLRYFASESCLL